MAKTVTQSTTEQFRYPVAPLTASGKPAKVDQQDRTLEVVTQSGTPGTGVIENFEEYTDADGNVGHRWDVVIKPGVGGSNGVLIMEVDADNDAGETRILSETWEQTTLAEEAADLGVGDGVSEALS